MSEGDWEGALTGGPDERTHFQQVIIKVRYDDAWPQFILIAVEL